MMEDLLHLEEVVEHYNSGGIESSTVDPLMKHVGTGLGLTIQEKADLVNFMLHLQIQYSLTIPFFNHSFLLNLQTLCLGVSFIIFLGFTVAFGQKRCGSADKLLHQLENNSKQLSFHKQIEKKYKNWSQEKQGGSIIDIPVVFHVVYKNVSENISEAQILSQLTILKRRF